MSSNGVPSVANELINHHVIAYYNARSYNQIVTNVTYVFSAFACAREQEIVVRLLGKYTWYEGLKFSINLHLVITDDLMLLPLLFH